MTDYNKLVEALRYCSTTKGMVYCNVNCKYGWEERSEGCKDLLMTDAADAIDDLQAQLPKRGKWKTTDAFPHRVYCSNCFRTYVPNDRWQIWVDKSGEGGLERNYCPSCGGKDGGSE